MTQERDGAALARIIEDQDGLATRAQVLACGFSDEWIEAQLVARRWLRLGRKVYLTTTGVPTVRQRERAALLRPGPRAALSHGSAARRWGLIVPSDGRVHLTVPYGASASPREDVALHRSRAFAHIVVDETDMPTVSAADTCVDLAVAAPDPRAGMRMLLHAALAMRVRAPRLRIVLDVRRPRRYRQALQDAATLLDEGVASALETPYAVDVEDAHGLPRARRQVGLLVDGRRRYEDCVYDTPEGELVVRLDGWRYHSDRRVALIDRRRDNAAELSGRGRLTFGWEEVTQTPCTTAREVAAALRARGVVLEAVSACPCLGTDKHSRDASQSAAPSRGCA